MSATDLHIERLREREPDLEQHQLPDGSRLIHIPNVPLPAGWNKANASVHVVVPQGYPYAQPDCFWTDPDLRLSSGALPQNAALTTQIPHMPSMAALWFSWHLQNWNATRDDLRTWLSVIRQRLWLAV